MTEAPVIVVGAGIGGLALAQRAASLGRTVVVLERSGRVGGQIELAGVGGREIDLGAESFAVRGGAGAELLDELGLGDELTLPRPAAAWVHADPRPYPLPATGLLGIPTRPLASDVRLALGLPGAIRAAADRVLPRLRAGADTIGERTLGEVVGRRMGRRATERLVDPVVRGVYSARAADLRLATASPQLARALAEHGRLAPAAAAVRASSPAGSAVAGVRGGIGRLVAALAGDLERLGARVRLGADVTAVAADHVVVDGQRIDGFVVVAAPGLVGEVTARRTITVVAAAVRSRELDAAPRGTGVLVAPGARGITARALTHSSVKWSWLAARDGVHLLRLSYDVPPGPERLAGVVAADVARLTGARDVEVLDVVTRTWTRTIGVRPPGAAAAPGPLVVGEASGRSGLAAILAHVRGDDVARALDPAGAVPAIRAPAGTPARAHTPRTIDERTSLP